MDEKKYLIPRKIWILWYQGWQAAPFIVKKCIDSWIKENPTWEVVMLDSGSIGKYVRLNVPERKVLNLSFAHRSDLVRLALLSKYGGVWADATTFCMKPLDDWIDYYSTSGFFVFSKPGRDRIMSNWLIASKKRCPIVSKLYENLALYWITNEFNKPGRIHYIARAILAWGLNRNEKTTKYWFAPVVTKLLRVYPYFVAHYLFERLVSTDPDCQIIWKNTKRLSADGPHKIKRLGLFSPLTSSIKKQIDNKDIPLYKLTWKYDHNMYSPSSLLFYLLQGRENQPT